MKWFNTCFSKTSISEFSEGKPAKGTGTGNKDKGWEVQQKPDSVGGTGLGRPSVPAPTIL